MSPSPHSSSPLGSSPRTDRRTFLRAAAAGTAALAFSGSLWQSAAAAAPGAAAAAGPSG
ncbi:twin-arginine translocation signal domain-containing protein, partial [Streptomyces sp. T-3]|nr:twin-arginine translocation signal domain-containing protein [Streptomyces sp. T-3]